MWLWTAFLNQTQPNPRLAQRAGHYIMTNLRCDYLQAEILDQVTDGSNVFTDAHKGYDDLAKQFAHETVSHMNEYVCGEVHTNGI